MIAKEKLLKNLNKILREDRYINSLLNSSGIEIDMIQDALEDIYNQYWFDSMTWGINILANEMDIHFREGQTMDEKRSMLQSKWRSKGKADEELLQTICDSWKNGEIEVQFNNKIILQFVGSAGIPTDLESLKNDINKAKPAYLIVDYIFKYLLIEDIENMTIEDLEKQTIGMFAF